MNIAELKKDTTEYHAKVTVLAAEIAKEIETELNKIAQTVKIDGFRKGKVPVSIVKRKYSDSVRNDIARNKIDTAIKNIVNEQKLNVAFEPIIEDFKNENNKDLEFTLKFETISEIRLPDFKNITLEKPVLEVADKDVQEQLDQLVNFSKKYDKEVKTKAKKGDQVTIDAIGYVDGEAFEGGKLDSHKLILGSKAFIPGFEDQLIGSKAGDDVLVKVDFPKDYHAKDLAGKPSEFKVNILGVHQAVTPEINDEFAQKFKCDNVEKLKEQIAKNIQAGYHGQIHVLMKMRLFDKLEKMLDFEVPKSLLEREVKILKNQENKLNDDAQLKAMAEEEKKKYFSDLAARRVRIGLMLAEYVKQKKLAINEDDIRQAIIEQARNYPGQEQQVISFYQNNRDAIENIKGPILEEKAVKAIFEQEISIKEKICSKDKLEKLLEAEIRD